MGTSTREKSPNTPKTMSDEERELENDLDSENEDDGAGNLSSMSENDKRAHHNLLERKRRDHIKDSFNGLKDAIPTLQGDKSSRAQILKKASEYIAFMRQNNGRNSKDIEDLRRQNAHLENQIRALEKAKSSGNFSSMTMSQSDLDKEDEEEGLEDSSLQPGRSLLADKEESPRKKVKL